MRYLKEEEMQIALRFLFLSMAITVIKKDVTLIENGPFKLKEPYTRMLNKMSTIAREERKNLRKKMLEQHIQVVFLNKNDSFSSYLFICNGREEKRNFFNPAIRKKVERIFHELMVKTLQSYQTSAVESS